ncbi:MAG: transglutaminase-like domain-containing protein, partial [Lachnospiraceae bacterium]|nr:transglutaminase-like domain-containing protein [Lachnospiraceae bacterium]
PKPTQAREPDQEPKPAQEPDDSPYIGTEGASARLRNLANELTQNADSAYDKCKIIEKYLRQYRYTTDAVGGYDPKSDMSTSSGMADIAERFLFDMREGYCVHFTSSMVMLLRLAGIPARAVSGYRYVFPFDGQDTYEVSSNCAHVWPEAYIANAGWVSFEPTAAYRPAEDYTWRRRPDGGSAPERDVSGAEVPGLPSFAEMQDGPSGQEALSEGGALPEDGGTRKRETRRILQIAAAVVSGILVLVFVLVMGALIARRMRYRLGTPEERLQMDVGMIRKILLRRAGEGFTDRGLLSDYVELAPEDFRPDIRRVFGAYYRIVYGDGETGVLDEENELARQVRERLRDSARRDGSSGPKIFGSKEPSPKDEDN